MEPGERTGTTVTWWASDDIFETTTYNLETITNRIREMAFLNKGLEIVVRDERDERRRAWPTPSRTAPSTPRSTRRRPTRSRRPTTGLEQVFKYDRGLVDYVEHLNRRKDKANPTVISFEAETPDNSGAHMSLEVAMQWNTSFTESVHTFANTINTHEGGTHEEGFRSALTSLVNHWGEEWGQIKKKEDRVSGDDIREGLTAIISIKLGEPAVRGPDQDQARQHRGQGLHPAHRQRPARRLVRAEPGRGQGHRPQVAVRGAGAHRGPQGARPGPRPQGPARRRRPARQAERLPVDQPRRVRGLHRRG